MRWRLEIQVLVQAVSVSTLEHIVVSVVDVVVVMVIELGRLGFGSDGWLSEVFDLCITGLVFLLGFADKLLLLHLHEGIQTS